MTRYERRMWFEAIYAMRVQYELDDQRATSMTVDGAIAYAVRLLDDPAALDAALVDHVDAVAPATGA